MKIEKIYNKKIILILTIIFLSSCFYSMFSLKNGIRDEKELINGEIEIPCLSPDDLRLGNTYKNQSMFDVYDIYDLNGAINGIALADYNNDGLIDYAIDNDSENTKILIFYDGDGTYDISDFNINNSKYYNIKNLLANDFNNDNMVDIVFTYSEYEWFNSSLYNVYGVTSILFGKGNNEFGNEVIISLRGTGIPKDPEGRINPRVASSDFDLDGDIDLIIGDNSGKVELLLNNGNGIFETSGYIEDFGRLSWGLTTGDFNLDGYNDFIISSLIDDDDVTKGHIYIKYNTILESENSTCFDLDEKMIIADLYFVPAVASLSSFDYDNDGDTDLIVGTSMIIYILINENGAFLPIVIGHSDEGEEGFEAMHNAGLAVSDFNNDGYDDFIMGAGRGTIRLFINKVGSS